MTNESHIVQNVALGTCTRCLKQFPKEKMYTFWHYFGGIRVCSDCWDKLEERERDK